MRIRNNKFPEMAEKVEAAHRELMAKASAVYTSDSQQTSLKRIESFLGVTFSTRLKTTGGRAKMQRVNSVYISMEIDLHARLLSANPAELVPTYAHELAHIIANEFAGRQVGHGPFWAAVMETLGHDPKKYHKMDVSAYRRAPKRYKYACPDCGTNFAITPGKHKRAQRYLTHYGQSPFRCPTHKKDLVFVGETTSLIG